MSESSTQSGYIGRFAPSPTGPLHFGSLVSALASYLDAHHNGGKWLVRMEDLDPPREQAGAADAILRCLEDYGLGWDDSVIYQSQRWDLYEAYLSRLRQQNLLYPCDCTRQDLQAMGGIYNGRCRSRHPDINQPHAQRLKLYDLPTGFFQSDELRFTDLIQGEQTQNLRTQAGDQILKRKDGLYAYQLAVVVDDIEQGITHIIRGSDLLDVTARQIFLFQLLSAPVPKFGHVTLASQSNGQKLSKQNLAPALELKDAGTNLWLALAFLGQKPPQELYGATSKELLSWGKNNWQLPAIKGLSAIYSPLAPSIRNSDE
ncbi:glutamyl-Q tRNA(Asp) synthetase [Cellvibrio zantedeschiae]|uniref:Glutamyl-Q tRNA(Asp) synthetase n=1 Tax=Cellvibrio zantedeschiae TaxID=1237077 RepID=A0ABQ3B658_9GAMM|nr:tRNA glutamyl-Q(34) synthetase GluQRS [Cellvibrio zantedeschiae]GGY80074.1 glutamyl-Q tRNA(Asp) synthetase [Cellvibrio zantedeschiae]